MVEVLDGLRVDTKVEMLVEVLDILLVGEWVAYSAYLSVIVSVVLMVDYWVHLWAEY